MGPPTPSQAPLTPSVGSYDGSVSALSGRSGRSARASRRQQARDDLTYLLSIAPLTDIPPLVKAISIRLSTISRLCAAKRAEIESLLLPDGSAPSPDDIEDLISIARPLRRRPWRSHHENSVVKDEK